MKKVLIVTYALPPVGGASVQRTTKFIKYLRGFKWEPVIVTAKNPSVPVLDISLLRDIPFGTKIHRARTLEPSYGVKQLFAEKKGNDRFEDKKERFLAFLKSLLMMPDPQVLWWPGLILKLWKVIRKERPDCLFVSAPPFSSLVPVVFLAKVFHKPVVIDFRDDWRFYRYHMENSVKSRYAKALDRIFERYVVWNCSAFTAATESYVKSILKRNGLHKSKKAYVITNGFDHDDFDTHIQAFTESLNRQKKIHLLYSGTVWRATSLNPFLKAVTVLMTDYPGLKKQLRITIAGRIVDLEYANFENKHLKDVVSLKGYISHDEVLKLLLTADILIISLADIIGASEIIPAKTFEYMATGKRILAIVPEGETSSLLLSAYKDNAYILYPDQIDLIAEYLFYLISNPKLLKEQKVDVSDYERKYLTGNLAEVLSYVTDSSKSI